MNITFIGAGYVGLVSGIMLSNFGYSVTCLDSDQIKIKQLQNGILPIYEKDLEKYFLLGQQSKNLRFTYDYPSGLEKATVIFITVGTPSLDSGGTDLSFLYSAILAISPFLSIDSLIVIKSTVPPNTCNEVIRFLEKRNHNVNVASNPEFLREGSAVYDFLNPDRILIGSNNSIAENLLRRVYKPLIDRGVHFISTDLVTSELTKYAANAFLASKITFINEIADLSEKVGGNINDIALSLGLDSRIGKDFLSVGPGFGGSCFPKDLLSLEYVMKNHGLEPSLISAVIRSNDTRGIRIIKRIQHILSHNAITPKRVSVLGVTFKAGTDDIRFSPAIKIIKFLLDFSMSINIYDPMGLENARKYFNTFDKARICFSNSLLEACLDTDVIIIATEWEEFRNINFNNINISVANPIIIDLRNMFDPLYMKNLGLKYYCLGISYES